MQFVLTAIDETLADSFEAFSENLDRVSVYHGSIFDVDCDAVVSPANSFGFMDGGIDAWHVWRFGEIVQDNVRMAILKYWQGELPIGTAEIVETQDSDIPFLIAAPTMRVPMYLGPDSINAYLAMRAIIMSVRNGQFREGNHSGQPVREQIQKIAVPGLGTGVGKIPFSSAAFQMCEAIRLHATGKHCLPKSWAEASENHADLMRKKARNLQVP